MSALAHWLEEEGIATTLIALFRQHAERIAPPRALWVPFELGRPLGPPGDGEFQTRVMRTALELLVSASTPGRIVDFDEDDPNAQPDPQWHPPDTAGASDVPSELRAIRAAYDRARAQHGRSTVGLTGLEIDVIAAHLVAYADDEKTPRPRSGIAPASLMRFCIDDLKAYYLEAASAGSDEPSSLQLTDWFWHQTVAAKLIQRIRHESAGSSDKQRQLLAEKSLVPGRYA